MQDSRGLVLEIESADNTALGALADSLFPLLESKGWTLEHAGGDFDTEKQVDVWVLSRE